MKEKTQKQLVTMQVYNDCNKLLMSQIFEVLGRKIAKMDTVLEKSQKQLATVQVYNDRN